MRTYRRLVDLGALTLAGLAATIIVGGAWEAVAAAFTISVGAGFALTFVALLVAGERARTT